MLVILEQAQEQSSPKKGNTSQGNLCKDYICKCRREGRTLQQQDVGYICFRTDHGRGEEAAGTKLMQRRTARTVLKVELLLK